MGFGAPWLLALLVAAAAPVAIHLIRRRDLRRVELPTLRLLHAAKARSRRRLQLADLLLLALRVVAVASLVFSFASPYRSVAAGDVEEGQAVVIVLDDSGSMGSSAVLGGTAFDVARREALSRVEALPDGVEVAIVLGGRPARVALPLTSERERARDAIERLIVGDSETDLRAAVELAGRIVRQSPASLRRVWVHSDERRGSGNAELPRLPDVQQESIPVALRPERNVALGEVWLTPHPARPDERVARLTILETPTDAPPSGGFDLRIRARRPDGEVLGETRIELTSARQSVDLALPAPSTPPNYIAIELQAEDGTADARPGDNRRWVRWDGPARGRVWVVNGSPHPSPHLDEVTFLVAALETSVQRALPLGVQRVDQSALRVGALDSVSVVILANVGALSAEAAQTLGDFVRAGGFLFITAGDRVRAQDYNARLGDLLPGRLEAPFAPAQGSLIAAEGWPPFRSAPTPRRALRLADLTIDTSAELRLPGGDAVLATRSVGEGKVSVWTTSADLQWSDLPLERDFLETLARLFRENAGQRLPPRDVDAGHSVDISAFAGGSGTIVGPQGRVENVGHAFSDTRHAGLYRIRGSDGTGQLHTFAINPADDELRADPAADETDDQTLEARGAASRRVPLSPLFLLLAGLALGAEGVLRARSRAAQRS